MIRNNQKLGQSNISKIIEMGKGDINVSVARGHKDAYVAVCFNQGFEGNIGRKERNTVGLTTDEDTPDTMFVFNSVKSIDVVMDKLNKAKNALDLKSWD